MDLADRVLKRRFVGREFLLWLWFESEIFEGTLRTEAHGSFGFWIERQIVLTAGKEGTRIKGSQPAAGREAKESLQRGKLPESAGFHLVVGSAETSFTLKGEQLAIAGLKLPTVLGGSEEDAPAPLLDGPHGPPRLVKRKREDRARQEARESDEAHESFYERMNLTRELEERLEALYRDFLALRLSEHWNVIALAMRAWAAGETVDAVAYRAEREGGAPPPRPKRRAAGLRRRG
jgi:hypothetical protein